MINLKKAIVVKRLRIGVGDILTGKERYNNLLAKVRWFFETEDALKVVRLRVSQGKATIGTYRDLAIWAGAVENDLRKECNND